MKPPTLLLIPLLSMILSTGASAQNAEPSAAQFQVDARLRQADQLLDDIRDTDDRLEKRLNTVVEALSQVTDSEDSRTRVARLKRDAAQALVKNTERYMQKRREILEQIRQPTSNLTSEQKTAILAALDTKVQERVDQIMAIQKSFPSNQDYEKYQVTEDEYRKRYRTNEASEQNKRVQKVSEQLRQELIQDIKEGITDREQSMADLEQALARTKDKARQQLIQEEIKILQGTLDDRRQQLATLLTAEQTPGPENPLTKAEANQLSDSLKEAAEGMARETNDLFRYYNNYLVALQQLNTAKANASQ